MANSVDVTKAVATGAAGVNEDGSDAKLASTVEETDKKCPNCTATMVFDPKSGKLKCPFCGTEKDIKKEGASFVARELDFASVEKDQTLCDWGTQTKTVECKSCGAKTVYDANQISNVCPYCGSNQVIEEEDKNVMAPGGVIPFSLDSKQAAEKFQAWLGRKFYCPTKAKKGAYPSAFKGVYVPYWTYDAQAESTYTGQYGINKKVKDKDGNERTETDWYNTSGFYDKEIDDFLICASTEQRESMMRGLEPFDTKKTEEYKPEYLAGFSATRYTLSVQDGWKKAKSRIDSQIRGEINNKIQLENNADSVRNVNVSTDYSNQTYKYLMFPVWISAFSFNGKLYQFVVNGQTGKVSGESPVDKLKVAITVILIIAIIAAIFYFSNR